MTTSLTTAKTSALSNVASRSVTYVSNELIRVGMEITRLRGVPDGTLVNNLALIERGLRAWLAVRELERVVIEFFDGDQCVEVYELPVTYDTPREPAEKFETKLSDLLERMAAMPPLTATRYRFLVTTADGSMPVPGWSKSQRADVSHLKKQSLLSRLIGTATITVDAFVFTGA